MYDFGHKPRADLPDDAEENHVMDGYNQMPELKVFGRQLKRRIMRVALMCARSCWTRSHYLWIYNQKRFGNCLKGATHPT